MAEDSGEEGGKKGERQMQHGSVKGFRRGVAEMVVGDEDGRVGGRRGVVAVEVGVRGAEVGAVVVVGVGVEGVGVSGVAAGVREDGRGELSVVLVDEEGVRGVAVGVGGDVGVGEVVLLVAGVAAGVVRRLVVAVVSTRIGLGAGVCGGVGKVGGS
jgi:hypothetical protein